MRTRWFLFLCFVGVLFSIGPHPAHAVLPPDVIISVGTQAAGFFSFFAVLFGMVIGVLGVSFRVCGQFMRQYSVHFAFVVLVVGLIGFQALYLTDMNRLHDSYQARISALQDRMTGASKEGAPTASGTADGECPGCAFYNDRIVLYVPGATAQVVSLDLNRRRDPNGWFTHYSFLDGYVAGETIDAYGADKSRASTVLINDFLREYERATAADASVRDRYTGTVELGSASLVFTIGPVAGDFLTRNLPEYTQFQSVGSTTVQLNGESVPAYYFVENVFSNDYTKRIFFPGYDDVIAETYQFLLWDDRGSFYLIDDTAVVSGPDAYQSHTWVVHKDGRDGSTKKAFQADVSTLDEGQWMVSLPEIHNATIALERDVVYQDENGRERILVSGTITDSDGERTISGILHYIAE